MNAAEVRELQEKISGLSMFGLRFVLGTMTREHGAEIAEMVELFERCRAENPAVYGQ